MKIEELLNIQQGNVIGYDGTRQYLNTEADATALIQKLQSLGINPSQYNDVSQYTSSSCSISSAASLSNSCGNDQTCTIHLYAPQTPKAILWVSCN